MKSVESAIRLFRGFFEREPKDREIVKFAGTDDIFLVIGKMDSVIYSTTDGERYEHRFKKSARPLLLVSHDGRTIRTLNGAYRFTDRGFVP